MVPLTPPIEAPKEVSPRAVGGLLSEYESVPDCCANPAAAKLPTTRAAMRKYLTKTTSFRRVGVPRRYYPEIQGANLIRSDNDAPPCITGAAALAARVQEIDRKTARGPQAFVSTAANSWVG